MRQLLSCVCCCALASVVTAQPVEWVTLKGQVVFPAGQALPKRAELNVNGPDKAACLAKGALLDESVLVNPKSRGVKNVVVFLRPDNAKELKAEFAANEIHPADAKRKPADVVIDQPCCVFVPRVTCARVGDTIVVKNPAAFPHNFFWDSGNNGTHNPNIAANAVWKMPNPLAKEAAPIQYKCTIHGWMTGYVRIFDHPYYAITDDDGKFEIKDAPAGKYRLVYWHENGVRGGAKGRFGEPVVIALPPGAKTMDMKPTDFDVSPK